MERPDHLGDERSLFAAGSSPLRGAIVAASASIVGLLVLVQGFDSGQSQTLEAGADSSASDPTVSSDGAGAGDANGDSQAPSTGTSDDIDDANADILPPTTAIEAAETNPATEATRPESEVVVLVVNSGAGKGAAAVLTAQLTEKGYETRSPTNADRSTASAVYHVEGYEAEAMSLAAELDVGSELVIQLDATPPVDDLEGAHVVAVVAAGGPVGA